MLLFSGWMPNSCDSEKISFATKQNDAKVLELERKIKPYQKRLIQVLRQYEVTADTKMARRTSMLDRGHGMNIR